MTTAERRGAVYIVNGAKKWITNGMFADYCTAAVRTGGKGKNGISALIIPMKANGVTCRKIENSGVTASGQYGRNPATGARQRADIDGSVHIHRVRRGRGAGRESAREREPRI